MRTQRGVHFFRPVPKEYLHSAELRDIMQFGSSAQAVFFKMRVAGVLHIFQFETRQVRRLAQAPLLILGKAWQTHAASAKIQGTRRVAWWEGAGRTLVHAAL